MLLEQGGCGRKPQNLPASMRPARGEERREGQAEAAFHRAGFRGGAHFHVPTWPGPRRPGAIQAGHTPGGWERNRPATGQTDGGMDEARS